LATKTTQILLERQRELDELTRHLGAALEGDGGTVLIEGPAGIGKTRLVEECLDLASNSGARCFAARGRELEREFAFGIVRQLFEATLAEIPIVDREPLFSGAAALAAPVFPSLETAPTSVAFTASEAALHGLYWLTANLARVEGPLALAIDDAHWADAPSLRYLTYLSNRLHGLPLLIVLAARPFEPGADRELLDELAADPTVHVVRPQSLTRDAVAQLLAARYEKEVDPAFAAACVEVTDGNPFLVQELATALIAEGVKPAGEEADRTRAIAPTNVTRAVMRRLSRLTAEEAAVAEAVAVLGDQAPTTAVAKLAGLSEDRVRRAAEILVQAAIFADDGRGYRHPLVRAAVYFELPSLERERRHAQAARILAELDANPDEVALHLLVGEPRADPWAIQTLREAARACLRRGAPDVAAGYLHRALAEPPAGAERPQLLLELGRAELAAHGPRGLDYMRKARELTNDPDQGASVALELGMGLFTNGLFSEAAKVLEDALAQVDVASHPLAARMEAQLVVLGLVDLEVLRRLGGLGALHSRARARSSQDPALEAAQGWIEVASRPPATEGAQRAERAMLHGGGLGTPDPLLLASAGPALMAAGRLEQAKALWDGAVEIARESASLALQAFAGSLRAPVLVRMGALGTAEADTTEIIERGAELATADEQVAVGLTFALASHIDALIERGELEAAERALQRSGLDDELPELLQFNYLLDSLGRLRLAQARIDEGVARLRECGRRVEAWGLRNPGFVPWRSALAPALARLGEDEEALELAREQIELAREFQVDREHGMALRALGLVVGGRDGISHLEQSIRVLASCPARLEHARALVDLGAALRRVGERSRARDVLRQGLDRAQRLGASALADQAHAELVAAGARPRRRAISGREGLTASELRVAEMAADGLSNRKIAELLFLSEKTVEGHLGNVYRKLDIRSRTQLPEALEPT
jgi:DNA-binding CsgD family transcriptional regulator